MKNKLRVLQVGKYYPPTRGGIETLLEAMCRGLKNQVDLKVLVASEDNRDSEELVDGVHVKRVGSVRKIAGSPICPHLWGEMRRAKADIVHVHLPHPIALLTKVFGGARGHLVCTYHSDIVRQKFLGRIVEPIQNLALRKASIISSSPNLIDSSPILRRHRERCTVIPFGVEQPSENRHTDFVATKLRAEFAGPILLAVGRLVYYKGFDTLIRAFGRTKTPGTLLIIGEGPMRPALSSEIQKLGLTTRVHLLGNVPETAPYYRACDIFVLPSIARSEAFGVVQLEAMSYGKPVINTSLDTGVPFVSRHEETGLTVTPGSVDELANAIEGLLEDEKMRKKYGAAARERVRTKFTLDTMVDRTLELYETIACTKRASILKPIFQHSSGAQAAAMAAAAGVERDWQPTPAYEELVEPAQMPPE